MPSGAENLGRGRYVLTTGANSGIGLAVAIGAAREGFRSVGTVRSAEKGEYLRSAALKAGVDVEPVVLDADSDEVAHAFRFDVARDSDVKPPRDWDLAGW